MNKQLNVLSVDMESWVHKYFLEEISYKKKLKDNNYIVEATFDILNILKKYNVNTTFFITGEIYEWYPWLIDKIKDMGHEIGFHTYTHRILKNKKILLEELKMGKKFIDEFKITGFRAPEMFMKREYCNLLKDWGFKYDSSIYSEFKIFEPIDSFLELPISTYPLYRTKNPIGFPRIITPSLIMKEIPFGSGYFIGFLGENVQWFIKRVNYRKKPAIFFIHPWQIREFPRDNSGQEDDIVKRIKMIPYNINRRDALEKILSRFPFSTMTRVINNFGYDTEQSILSKRGEITCEKS